MIGTIRKHSSWLWWLIAGLTIISFVAFMGSAPTRGNHGGGHGGSGYGTIYGREVTPEMLESAKREFYLGYWMQHEKYPSAREGVSDKDAQRESYVRLLLSEKARALGIRVPDTAVRDATAEMLNSVGGRNRQPWTLDQFNDRVLKPEQLTVADLQNYFRSTIAIEQARMVLGLPGALVSPQEAAQLYDREYQEISAQAVFFSYSNYLAQVTVTPAAAQDFYTKNMAAYREPEKLQASYVTFELSNFLASAELKLGRTNLDNNVEALYRQEGMAAVPGATNVDQAKAKIRAYFLRQEQAAQATKAANDFASALYAMKPVAAGNLAVVAKEKGLAVHTTAPFANGFSPEGLPETFAQMAFKVNGDQQVFSEIFSGTDALYLLAIEKEFPSTVPTLVQLGSRVGDDYRAMTAQNLARTEGAMFHSNVTAQVIAGKTFAQAAVAAGHSPVMLKPFSLSSPAIPEAGDRAEVGAFKQAAFTTPPGKVSQFFPTSEGGFVLSPQSVEPVDNAKKSATLPEFIKQVRRGRQNQAFNEWLQMEASRELRDTPIYADLTGGGKQ